VIAYRFRDPQPGEPRRVRIVLSVDSPDDELPPATYAFPVEGPVGEMVYPLPLEDRRYVARGSGVSPEGVASAVVEVPVD